MAIAERALIQQDQLKSFVEGLRKAIGQNLVSVVLYGSAVSQDFHHGYSDLNLLCVVNDLSAASIQALAPALKGWRSATPLFFTRTEFASAMDTFPIEMMDIRDQHHLLAGENLFPAGLKISPERHKAQLEHELQSKLMVLRQHYMNSVSEAEKVMGLMLESISSFIVLFRHTLIELGETAPQGKRDTVEQLARKCGFDPGPFRQLLDVREGKSRRESLDAHAVFAAYVQAIESVCAAVRS
jgi:hypothetical protein